MYKDNMFIEESEKLINKTKYSKEEKTKEGFIINTVTLNTKEARTINRFKSKNITISFNKNNMSNKIEELINVLINNINELLKYLKLNNKSKVLFIGLGNKEITCDKFGYLMIEKLVVEDSTYKIYKDVEGLTNIKSIDFIKSMANLLEVDLVVIFDSLYTNDINRLGSSIQLSTGGLVIPNIKKQEISKKTIKTNIISIGIPTLINLKDIVKNKESLLITTKDIDKIVDDLSSIVSISINRIF